MLISYAGPNRVNPMILVSIVIPVKNEFENLPDFRQRLNSVLNTEIGNLYSFELLINDNDSTDGSREYLRNWQNEDHRVSLLQLSEDVGFQGSIILGMRRAKGKILIVLQSDLQDPPELIPEFIDKWESGNPVVAGLISKRQESIIDRSLRRIFYSVLRYSSENKAIKNFQDYFLVDESVYKRLSKMTLNNSFLRAEIASRFGVSAYVYYDRNARRKGTSKFDLAAKWSLAVDGILLNGSKLVRHVTIFAILLSLICLTVSLFLLFMYFGGIRFSAPGWLSLALLLMGGLGLNVLLLSGILELSLRTYSHVRALEAPNYRESSLEDN